MEEAAWTQLRRLDAADLAVFHAYRSDPELARYQGWEAQTEVESLAFLVEQAATPAFAAGGGVQLGITDGADGGELAGDMYLALNEAATEVTVGFTLRHEHQGKGLATQALQEAVALAFRANPGVTACIADADVRNGPCLRLLERVGFVCVGQQTETYKGEICEEKLFRLERPQCSTVGGAPGAAAGAAAGEAEPIAADQLTFISIRGIPELQFLPRCAALVCYGGGDEMRQAEALLSLPLHVDAIAPSLKAEVEAAVDEALAQRSAGAFDELATVRHTELKQNIPP